MFSSGEGSSSLSVWYLRNRCEVCLTRLWIIFGVCVPCPHCRHVPEQPPKVKPGAEKAEKAPVKRRPILQKTFLDQDVEYLFEKNDQDADLDEQLKEDLRKKKSDPRYIEMQVLSKVLRRELVILLWCALNSPKCKFFYFIYWELVMVLLCQKKKSINITECVSRAGTKRADRQWWLLVA